MTTILRATAAILFFLARAASGQTWVPLGPEGGSAPYVVRDAGDPSKAWASTGRIGVLRSVDGGRSWSPANSGLPDGRSGALVRLADGTLLVAAYPGGLFRSVDNGSQWTAVGGAVAGASIASFAADPKQSATVYAGGSSGLYRSDDSGVTWTLLPHPGLVHSPVSVDPTTSRVYAGLGEVSDSNAGTLQFCPLASPDRGSTWTQLGCYFGGSTVIIIGFPPLTAYLPDSHSPSTLYIAAADYKFVHDFHPGGVFRSDDGGATFQNVSAGLNTSVGSLAFGPAGELLAGTAGGLFVSRDRGATWLRVEGFPEVLAGSLVVGPGLEILAGTTTRGVWRSPDGGVTWELSSRGLRATVTGAVVLDPRFPSTIWWGSADFGGGISVSSDGGGSWTDLAAFPTDLRVDAIAIDPSDSRRELAGASFATPIGVPLSRLEVSSDRGLHWQVSTSGSSGFGFIDGFAFDPLVPGRVLAGGSPSVNESRDSGATWSILLVNGGLSPVFDPENPRRAYTTTHSSADGGVTWVQRDFQIASARRIVLGPGGVLYLGGDTGVWRSDDFGATFRAANAGIENRGVRSLVVDRRSGAVYAGLGASNTDPAAPNVYRTTDGGTTWIAIAGDLPQGQDVSALAVDPTWGAVYAGTLGGVYRWIPSSASCSPDPTTLCLGGGRFRAQVAWSTGATPAPGQARSLTADAGAFWFFSANNLELVVKVVDGSAVDGNFWVFGGGLTDVEYDLSITDSATGAVWRRHNAAGELASFADTAAFPASPALQ